ncbi:MAG: helix-turn-helix domain-containing protein [Prevotellaceae bacterium]|jgi:AraC-like DNA-binding protein|nr:helix-turn-helix domain-containing protein [Prevotellaceae bacterium]
MKKNEKQVKSTNYFDNNEIYIECIEKNKGEINISESSRIRFFFVMKGSCSFFYEKHFDVQLEKGNVVLLPPRSKCIIDVKNNIHLLVVYLTVDLNFSSDFPFEALTGLDDKVKKTTQKSKKEEVAFLKISKTMFEYLKHMKLCLQDEIKSTEFFQMKQRELLYYFGKCYSKEDLYSFFHPVLTNDIAFSRMIYGIYEKVHTVTDMAKEMNYSLSGFKKRFERVFGMSAYKWLCQEKAKRVFHAITCSRETFTQISYDFGFSSPAHMNNFCRKMFGDTPGNIRAKKMLKKK